MKNDEKSRFAPSLERKRSKEAVPVRRLSVDNVKSLHSQKPRQRLSSNEALHTVTHCKRTVPRQHNITTTCLKNKKDLPLTTPDRHKSSTQNIFNIIFNNSHINIQNTEQGGGGNNILVINAIQKEADNTVNIVVKGIENKQVLNNGVRVDRRGVPIVKKGRRHIVSFLDRVEQNKVLVDIKDVESYKQYNLENSYGERGKRVSCTASLACCLLF
jgi:hypothetical protein